MEDSEQGNNDVYGSEAPSPMFNSLAPIGDSSNDVIGSNQDVFDDTTLSAPITNPAFSENDNSSGKKETAPDVLRPGSACLMSDTKAGPCVPGVRTRPKSKSKTAKYQLSGIDLELVFAELEVRISRLLQRNEFRNDETYDDLEYLKASTRYGNYRCKERSSCLEKLSELGVVALFKKIFSLHFDMDKFHRVLRDILVVVWNGTDMSVSMCHTVIDSNTHELLFKYLDSDRLGADETNVGKIYIIKGLLGIINNISRLIEHAPATFRDLKGIEILKKFTKSNNSMIHCKVEITLAYMMTEKQYEEMDADDDSIGYIIGMLRSAMNSPDHHSKTYGFSADEIVQGLNKIAVSDSNKLKIVQHGAVEYYVALMQPECTTNEHIHAARGIWILAFKCVEDIKKVSGCVQGIKALVENSDLTVQKEALGALWILEGKDHPSATSDLLAADDDDDDDDSPHVFISYQWANQSIMLKVRDHLRESGYKVWMDVDAMSGSILEAMASAVEKAVVVLICMSQKYKESPNCRTEAEYTFRLHKAIVPLCLEPRYFADGWLGALVGNKLYFDFGAHNRFTKSLSGLLKELGDRGKSKFTMTRGISTEGSKSPAIVATQDKTMTFAVPSESASNWSSAKVIKWVNDMDIDSATEWFRDLDGAMLMELKELHRDAPEFYFSTLKNELRLSLKQVLQFTKELKKIK